MLNTGEHRYGPQVNLISDPALHSLLAKLCSPETVQPTINQYIELLYSYLLHKVANEQFELEDLLTPTRMTSMHPSIQLESRVVKYEQKVVVVNLARAGTLPSHVCYNTLNYLVKPELVRQDHILASRTTNENEQVTGTMLGGAKIGGDVQDATVLFPDPMGATGHTLASAIRHYREHIAGQARKFIALNLIVTPEYLKHLLHSFPDVVIYALRVDRGLSAPQVLDSVPGTYWNEERGLNDKQYIVPGGGGFGEIMNNSFV